MSHLSDLGRKACEAARRAGADAADAYLTTSRQLSVDVFNRKPESFEKADVAGAGIRVWRDTATGYAYTTALSAAGMVAAAQSAVDNAAAADGDEFNGLPHETGASVDISGLDLTSKAYDSATTTEKIDFTLAMENAAFLTDPRVKGCESVAYAEEEATVALVNTRGFDGEYTRQVCYGFIDVLAEEKGETQTGFYYAAGHSLAELDAVATGVKAAQRAVAMLGGRPIKPKRLTAVFDPLVFIQILTAISPAFSAEAVQKGRSFLAGATGEKIGADRLSLIDDGRLPAGLGTAPFDDEGVPTQLTPVIQDGVLTTFLFNTYAARKEKREPTGNGRRGSFKTPLGTSPTNLYVKPGTLSRGELFSGVSDGIYVLGLQGLHAGVSPVTGQFSAGAFGLTVKSGELGAPVREVTIASTCRDILANIVAIADDLTFVPMGAAYGAPTVAVGNVVVSGR